MTNEDDVSGGDDFPMVDQEMVQDAAWHLSTLISRGASFDGQIMFLTAVHLAAVGTQAGLAASGEPPTWLTVAGIALTAAWVLFGVSSLRPRAVPQFPSPIQVLALARLHPRDRANVIQRRFNELAQAAVEVRTVVEWRSRRVSILGYGVPMSLGFVIAMALTA